MTAGKLIDFESLGKDVQELVNESLTARERSYSPYSKYKVGAAIRCDDGTISRGCNIENMSYPVGMCAERVALGRAVSDGKTKFTGIAIIADRIHGTIPSPCGMCRQALVEFGDMPVYLAAPDMKEVLRMSVRELLPIAFGDNAQTEKYDSNL